MYNNGKTPKDEIEELVLLHDPEFEEWLEKITSKPKQPQEVALKGDYA